MISTEIQAFIKVFNHIHFSYFSAKTYVVGTLKNHVSQHMLFWYLLGHQATKASANLHKCTDLPEPQLLTYEADQLMMYMKTQNKI